MKHILLLILIGFCSSLNAQDTIPGRGGQYYPEEIINFDFENNNNNKYIKLYSATGNSSWAIDTLNNYWSKPFPDSDGKCLFTKLDTNYKDTLFAQFRFISFHGIRISFKTYYDINFRNLGVFQLSTDSTKTWQNWPFDENSCVFYGNQFTYEYEQEVKANFFGDSGLTGTNQKWKSITIEGQDLGVYKSRPCYDDLYKVNGEIFIRFAFFQNHPKDTNGWAIDDLSISTQYDMAGAINETTQKWQFLYPNPVKSDFRIESENDITSVILINLQGQPVKQWNSPDDLQFNIREFPPGIYYLKVVEEKRKYFYHKLIKL